MAELHLLLVIDSETGKVRLADMATAPVDSSECVWDDPDWRRATEDEESFLFEVERTVIDTLRLAELYG